MENEEKDTLSILSYYKTLISFRKESEDLLYGDYELIENGESVAVFRRGGLLIVLNHSDGEIKREIEGEILMSTENERKNGFLKPWEALIVRK